MLTGMWRGKGRGDGQPGPRFDAFNGVAVRGLVAVGAASFRGMENLTHNVAISQVRVFNIVAPYDRTLKSLSRVKLR